jgi:hypothetical protein
MKGHLRKRGEAWELRAYAGIDPITNRQKYVTRTFRGGKRDAEEALARFVTDVSGGGHAAQDTTVGDLIRQWLDLAKPELSPTTARGYDWIIKTYITPTLDKVPLARLRAAQLDRFYAKLRDEGGQDGKPLSAATVRQVHAILRRALQQGVRWGWITTNPASLASPPRVRNRQLEPPDPDQVVQLIETAEKGDPGFACFILLAATTGARRRELCGLRWSDIDLKGKVLTISLRRRGGAQRSGREETPKFGQESGLTVTFETTVTDYGGNVRLLDTCDDSRSRLTDCAESGPLNCFTDASVGITAPEASVTELDLRLTRMSLLPPEAVVTFDSTHRLHGSVQCRVMSNGQHRDTRSALHRLIDQFARPTCRRDHGRYRRRELCILSRSKEIPVVREHNSWRCQLLHVEPGNVQAVLPCGSQCR